MPNRIIKETIRTSRTVNGMSDFQFRLWVYLITYVDDFGRGSADPELIKGLVFPRRKRVSESDIQKALAELAGMGCVNLYDVDGEPYFYFPNWGSHQRIQTKKSKFPEPTGKKQRQQKSTVTHGDPPPESNPIQSESELESKSNQIDESALPDEVKISLHDWLAYKIEKRQPYKPKGLQALISKVSNNCDKYGQHAVIECISLSMANNWQGIVWDRIEKEKKASQKVQQQGSKSFSEIIKERVGE